MALYLVQHGKSLSKEQDPEQGLSKEIDGLRGGVPGYRLAERRDHVCAAA